MSASAILLFVFLLPGTVFSYSLSSIGYYSNYQNSGTSYYITNIYHFNMTYVGTHFLVQTENYTKVVSSVPGLLNRTLYNNTTTVNGSAIDFYSVYYPILTPAFLPFFNFTVTTYSWANLQSIPVIKFYDNNGGYLIVSAQYGFPIVAYNRTTSSSYNYTMNLTLNFVKNPPPFITSYTLYTLNLTYKVGNSNVNEIVYVVSPNASFSYINTKLSNFTVSELVVNAKGYATILLPISGFPFIEPSGNIFINGTEYTLILVQTNDYGYIYYKTEYDSMNNPFMGTMLGHYYVIFVPNGGNVTIMFSNFNDGVITNLNVHTSTSSKTSVISNWILISGIGILAIVVFLVYFLKIRRK